VLEATHIIPKAGPLTYHVTNGLLLRADLHTLFDCGLIGVDPKTRQVVTAKELAGSTYVQFEGRRLRAPMDAAAGPSTKSLAKRFALFEA
jgi:predicted restriction endonuclease